MALTPPVQLPLGAAVWVRGAAGERRPGTVGAFAANADGLWLLSANHVLAANGAFLPTADPADGVYVGERRVSRTIVYRKLERAGNRADAAACLLDPTAGFRPAWPPDWKLARTPICPPPHTKVKVRVAGLDYSGTVARRGTFRVAMQHSGFPAALGAVEFVDSLLVRAGEGFARPGNSGALVVTADCRPVGLITGTSLEHGGDFVVVSLLRHVLKVLGLPPRIFV